MERVVFEGLCTGWDHDLTVDGQGNLYSIFLAHIEHDNKLLVYGKREGRRWMFGEVDRGDLGHQLSMDVDGEGGVHLLYSDAFGGPGRLMYATGKGSDWVFTVIDEGAGDSGCGLWNGIALDRDDKVHIAWEDGNYATNGTGSWVSETWNPDSSYDVAVTVDAGGLVHACGNAQGTLVCGVRSGGKWESTVVDAEGNNGFDTSMTKDSIGAVHVSYATRLGPPQDLRYATNARGEWVSEIIDDEGDVGGFTSIAADKNNMLHIGYFDDTNKTIKYAFGNLGDWTKTTVEVLGERCEGTIDLPEYAHKNGLTRIAVYEERIYIMYYSFGALCLTSFPSGYVRND